MKLGYLEKKECDRLIDYLIMESIIAVTKTGYSIADYDFKKIVDDYKKDMKNINVRLEKLTDSKDWVKDRNQLIRTIQHFDY